MSDQKNVPVGSFEELLKLDPKQVASIKVLPKESSLPTELSHKEMADRAGQEMLESIKKLPPVH